MFSTKLLFYVLRGIWHASVEVLMIARWPLKPLSTVERDKAKQCTVMSAIAQSLEGESRQLKMVGIIGFLPPRIILLVHPRSDRDSNE